MCVWGRGVVVLRRRKSAGHSMVHQKVKVKALTEVWATCHPVLRPHTAQTSLGKKAEKFTYSHFIDRKEE